jgi:hypothetical protein
MNMLFDLCAEEGWSGKRLKDTAKHFIRTKPWIAWSIADFMNPLSKSRLRLFEKGKEPVGKVDIYKIGDRYFWKEPDGIELPFERVNLKSPEAKAEEPVTKADPDKVAEILKSVGYVRMPEEPKPTRPKVEIPAEEAEMLRKAQQEAEKRIRG